MMTDNKFYARFAIALLASAFLVPILITALARDTYAVAFFCIAILIAVLFAAVSWTERSSKLVISVAGVTACVSVLTIILLTQPTPWKRRELREAEAKLHAMNAKLEAAREQAIAERPAAIDG